MLVNSFVVHVLQVAVFEMNGLYFVKRLPTSTPPSVSGPEIDAGVYMLNPLWSASKSVSLFSMERGSSG